MAETSTLNGHGTSKDADKLARSDYADRAAAALPDGRAFGKDILKLLGEYDPDHVSIQDMRRMLDDYTIKMSLHYSQAPIVSAEYDFECEDPRIRAAVKENYDRIHVPLMLVALNSWGFGYQGCVKAFKYGRLEGTYEDPGSGDVKPVWPEDGPDCVLMDVPIPLPPEVTNPEIKKGKFAGIRTTLARRESGNPESSVDADLVPPEFCLWFAHQFEQHFRNYYGRSRLIPAYKPWYSFWGNWYNRDRHADQDADPPLQIWYPPGDSWVADPERPGQMKKQSNRVIAEAIGPALRNGATIVWPSDVHVAEDGKLSVAKKWEAAYLTGGDNLAVFNDLLDRLEVAKYRACMVPEQTLIEAIKGTGARNVTGEQTDTFSQSLQHECDYFDRVINEYLIRPFVEANFGGDAPRCAKKTTGFNSEDFQLASELIQLAFTADPNALPIKFEALLEQAKIATYTKKEQEERQKAIDEAAQAQAEAQAAAQPVGALPGEQDPSAAADPNADPAAASSQGLSVHLDGRPGADWARQEARRRDENVAALAERLDDVVRSRYLDAFEAAADALAAEPLADGGTMQLARRGGLIGRGGLASRLAAKARDAIEERVAGYRVVLEEELASLYHAAGHAELQRLGLSGESWDVGRAEIQDWASQRAGELIVTMDKTVVEQHVRPWLEKALADPDFKATDIERAQGIPVSSVELAAQLTDAFSEYPQWMAERVVRTEAATGYNAAAADMWERVGVSEVKEFDGLGGKSGQSDPHCVARNGRVVSIEQFRKDNAEEHPNGTLGAVAVVPTDRRLVPPAAPRAVYADARRSGSAYAIQDGLILSVEATGRALADG